MPVIQAISNSLIHWSCKEWQLHSKQPFDHWWEPKLVAHPTLHCQTRKEGFLAVDVDEVLCRCAEAFVLWQTGKVLLDVNECFQICYAHSNAAAREEFFNSEAAVNAQTVPGSFEALQALRALNFEVHAITARPISSQSMTFQFLQRCFPGMISGCIWQHRLAVLLKVPLQRV